MWRIRRNNLIINDYDNFFSHRAHLEKLLQAKPHVQNKGPEMPFFLKNKISTNHLLRSIEDKKCYENAVIFSRLLEIDSSVSSYNKVKCPLYCAAFDKKKYNFDKEEKMRDTQRENEKLFIRLVRQKSYYPTKGFLKVNNHINYYKSIVKRQRFDNPNIDFATFNEFKKNLAQSFNLRRTRSVADLKTLSKRRKNNYYNISDNHLLGINNNDINFVTNVGSPVNLYRNFINSQNRVNNNGFVSEKEHNRKIIGKHLTRCQSAFLRK